MQRMAESVPKGEFWRVARPLFIVYATLALSDSANVVGASFSIWDSGLLVPMIADNAHIFFPIMYAALSKASKLHWKTGIQNRASHALRAMRDCNTSFFDAMALAERKKRISGESFGGETHTEGKTMHTWATIARTAGRTDRTVPVADKLVEFGKFFKALDRCGRSS
jgi:hypothetical protein